MPNENTQYAGQDWSRPGATCNRDLSTGIRFGVVSQNSLNPEAASDIFDNARDLSYEGYIEDVKKAIRNALEEHFYPEAKDVYEVQIRTELRGCLKDYFSDWKCGETSPLDDAVESVFEDIDFDETLEQAVERGFQAIEDDLNDNYQCDEPEILYEQDGYCITRCLQTDFFVSKSPYYTYAQFCSPCVPSAVNLDHPFHFHKDDREEAEAAGFVRGFCLGHDFFDSHAPYTVFRVDDNSVVSPPTMSS